MKIDEDEEGSMKRFPFGRMEERPGAGDLLSIPDEGDKVLVEGEVIRVKEKKALSALVRTETFTITVRVFRPTPVHRRYLVRGADVRLVGKITRWRGLRQLVNPRILF